MSGFFLPPTPSIVENDKKNWQIHTEGLRQRLSVSATLDGSLGFFVGGESFVNTPKDSDPKSDRSKSFPQKPSVHDLLMQSQENIKQAMMGFDHRVLGCKEDVLGVRKDLLIVLGHVDGLKNEVLDLRKSLDHVANREMSAVGVAKIPTFSEGDPTLWLARCAVIYPNVDKDPNSWPVKAVSNFDGAALCWWTFELEETRRAELLKSWADFSDALKLRCNSGAYVLRAEKELEQLACGEDYSRFEEAFNRLVAVVPAFGSREKVRRFRGALLGSPFESFLATLDGNLSVGELQTRVGTFALNRPTASQEVSANAVRGLENRNSRGGYRGGYRGGERQWTPLERRARDLGLCRKCLDPYQHGHVCKTNKSSAYLSFASPPVSPSLLFVDGLLDGRRTTLLVDSGATHCFVSTKCASKLGLKVDRTQTCSITFADSSSKPCQGSSEVLVSVAGVGCKVKFLVADIGFDAVLGLSWLRETRPVIDWQNNKLGFSTIPVPKPSHSHDTTNSLSFRSSDLPCLFVSSAELTTDPEDEVFLISVEEESAVPSGNPAKTNAAVDALLKEFKDVLFLDDLPPGLPKSRGEDFRIDLIPNARPFVRPMPRFSPDEQDKIQAEVKSLLEKGFVRPSNSPFGAQILFVKKKDGSSRMCLDYRSLNEHTVRDVYPLPLIDTLFDKLAGKRVFSKLDLRSGYYQMRVRESDVSKTAFRTPVGSFEFTVLPFGLCNAPSAFSRMLDVVLPPLEFGDCVVKYIDDILISSPDMTTHLVDLRRVFERLVSERLYPKLSKCEFGVHEVEFLGHVLGREGIKADPHKVKAVLNAPTPTNVSELRGFLGLLNYFQRFISNFAARSVLFTDLLKKETPWTWSASHDQAFQGLKSALVSAPVLRPFDRRLPVVIQTDASDKAVGAVLLQDDGKGRRPVAFTSKKLSPAERNYPPQELEMYAIIHAFGVWRHYLLGRRFIVETDHQSLTQLKKSPDPTRRLARWYEEIADFDFEVVYYPGPKNKVADYLSRFAADSATAAPVMLNAIVVGDQEFLEKVRTGYVKDDYFIPVHQALVLREEVAPKFSSRVEKFVARDGLLYFTKKDTLAIPDDKALRTLILLEIHDAGGHFGVEKTYEALERRFFWPHMGKSTKSFVRSCDMCQRQKGAARSGNGLLMPLEIPDRSWSSVSMDFVTGLPLTARGHDAILTVVDRFSKMTHVIPTRKTATAQDTASLFFSWIYRLHGLPRDIVSDRDPQFTSDFWQSLFTLIGTKLSMSTANHAKTDGQTEAQNKTIGQLLRVHARDDPTNWDSYLPLVEFAMNNSVNVSTGLTPFYINYGLHPWIPADLSSGQLFAVGNADVNTLIDKIAIITKLVKDNISVAQDKQAATANEGRRGEKFKVGDLVMTSRGIETTALPSATTKLQDKFTGPFKVVKVVNDNAYELDIPGPSRIHPVVNVEFLKPFIDNPVEFGSRTPTPQAPDHRGHVEIERILDKRIFYRKPQYLVRWKGHKSHRDEWLGLDKLDDAQDLVNEYEAKSK
jgi:hypothetical protein